MIPIWKPLFKISVVTSKISAVKAGAIGFVVLLADSGYPNHWYVSLVITRNGKKGQRRLLYGQFITPKVIYTDLFMESEVAVLLKNESENPGVCFCNTNLITMAMEPYKSRDILNWDMWDFLGWVCAASQLYGHLHSYTTAQIKNLDSNKKTTNFYYNTGLRPIWRASVVNPSATIENIDLTKIDVGDLQFILAHICQSINKTNISSIVTLFNNSLLRTTLIENCRKAIACHRLPYTHLVDHTLTIHDKWTTKLMKMVSQHKSPGVMSTGVIL